LITGSHIHVWVQNQDQNHDLDNSRYILHQIRCS